MCERRSKVRLVLMEKAGLARESAGGKVSAHFQADPRGIVALVAIDPRVSNPGPMT